MSAICGIINFDGKPVDPADIGTMVRSSPYRGPDGTGYWIHENAGFAHMAFHLTPESVHENQPLLSDDGRYVLCADVRLDNRDQLFEKLKVGICPDRVVTDADLIMQAWLRWGERCTASFLGDFVFSIWDTRDRKLFLARDPLGGYCVHIHRSGSCFMFASELTAILDLPWVRTRINEDRVLQEIAFLPRTHEEGFFHDIYYLPPAHCLRIDQCGDRQWRYWDIEPENQTQLKNEDVYAECLRDTIDQAVKSRLRCSGPVGISLSGGRDSTLLAASAARQLPSSTNPQPRLRSFSYVFTELASCDESEWIEPVVKMYDLDAHYINGDELWSFRHMNSRELRRDYLWTNCFVNLPIAVAEAAEQSGCRLLMDGQLGDVLFDGPVLAAADFLYLGQVREFFSYLNQLGDRQTRNKAWFNHGIAPLLPEGLKSRYRRIRNSRKETFIAGLAGPMKSRLKKLANSRSKTKGPAGMRPGARRRYHSICHPAWPQGMAAVRGPGYNRYGVELTSPLFDRRVVELMLSIPEHMISLPHRPRNLQQKVMRMQLPETVSDRVAKTSFTPLLEKGVLEIERDSLMSLLQQPLIVGQGWVDQDWLNQQLAAGSQMENHGYPLSACIHLELWLRALEHQGTSLARMGNQI